MFNLWALGVGWESQRLQGVEFRQTQTALSALFIARENDFSLAYPTPVLGKPWSIPLEFPLYQWTVVGLDRLTGWGLVQSGRAVSAACLYLTLPAIWLLLGWWRIAPRHRAVVLAVFLTCPLLIFYSRAFLIETMAVMFSVWFCAAYWRGVATKRVGWLLLAVVAGTGAGLVKVTTLLLHLLPLAAYSLWRLWRHRVEWLREAAWMLGTVATPVGVSAWWVWHADAVKVQNLAGAFLRSEHMRDFNFGTQALRLDPEIWSMQGRILREQITFWPLLLAAAFWAMTIRSDRRVVAAGCVAVFLAAPLIFPLLYAYHEYYFVANVGWLMLALGLVLVGLLEKISGRLALAAAVAVVSLQAAYFGQSHFPVQSVISSEGDPLSMIVGQVTEPDEVVIVTGQDWSSAIPFYAQRRALMLRADIVEQPDFGRRVVEALSPDRIGALVIGSGGPSAQWLIDQLAAQGFDPAPVLMCGDSSLYLPHGRATSAIAKLSRRWAGEVRLAAGHAWPLPEEDAGPPVAGQWLEVATLSPLRQQWFDGISPRPVRFFSQFGTGVERADGRVDLNAHPETRLVFSLPAGRHVLRTRVHFLADAYAPGLLPNERTDGIQVVLRETGVPQPRMFFDRLIDPVNLPAHRQRLAVHIPFTLTQAGEVELFVGPGPAGSYQRDWVWLGRVTIE